MLDQPLFMENDDWYYFDFKHRKYVLTDSAPQEAIDSYQQYCDEVSRQVGHYDTDSQE